MRNLYFSLLVFSFSLSLSAQQADTTKWLNDVVVTGTRTPKLLKDTPIQTRLISSEDIEKVDANNIEDLLQQELPGVEFSYAMNQQTHLNMSGFGGQNLLFLIDGERLAGETMDDVDFTRLNMANVERIEIVKGAASALYGSNAGGGVINIITKEGTEPWKLHIDIHGGAHNNKRQNWVWGLNRKHWQNTVTMNANLNNSFTLKNGAHPATQVIQQVYGDSIWSFKEQLTYRPTAGLKFIGRLGFFERRVVRDINTPDYYYNITAGLRSIWEISMNDHLDMTYSFDQYDKAYDYKQLSKFVRHYSNVQNAVRGVYSHSWKQGDILTVGADYTHDYLMNKNMGSRRKSQDIVDAFAQYDWLINTQWEVVGALRYDYFSDSKNARFTPKLSTRYSLPITVNSQPSTLNIRFGYGMGFRAPSLKEKYYDFDMAGIWIVQGNPNLKAETSHNFTASADYTTGHYNFTLSAYYNDVHDKLATGVPHYLPNDPAQLYLDYMNLDRYSVYGGEATAQARWNKGWSAKLSYAYTNERTPKDKDGNTVNNQYIPARHHSLTARVDWDKQWSRRYGLRLSLNGRFLSSIDATSMLSTLNPQPSSITYPAYTLWKLSATHRFGTACKWTLALDNLLNYRPKYYYYNSPMTEGLTFMTTISLDVEKLFSSAK